MRSSPFTHRFTRVLATVALVLTPLLAPTAPARAGPVSPGPWVWPLLPIPRVVRPFEPPDSPYGPGHRGVDLAGELGEQVFAMGSGVVTFAGSVAGRGIVVVDHGRLLSTYQPVSATVSVGTTVTAGQQIGLLEAVHSHCSPDVCLHLGVMQRNHYLDPLTLLGPRPVVLKPLTGSRAEADPAGPELPEVRLLPRWPAMPWMPVPNTGGPARMSFALPTHIGSPAELVEGPGWWPGAGQARGCAWR